MKTTNKVLYAVAALLVAGLVGAPACVDEDPLGQLEQEVLTSVDEMQFATSINVGVLSSTYIVGWAPSDGTHTIQNTSIIVTGGHDYTGTTIASIDATNINVGDVRIICNFDAWLDDAVITLSNEDPRESTATNRIIAPGGAKGSLDPHRENFYIAPFTCQPIMYMDVDFDTQTKRWVVVGSQPRIHRAVIQSLQIFPAMTATLSGSSSSSPIYFDAADECAQVMGGAVGQGSAGGFTYHTCEAGGSTEQKDYTAIRLKTSSSSTQYLGGLKGFYTGSDYNGNPWGLGPVKVLVNYGPGRVVLRNYNVVSSGGTDTGDEFYLPGGRDIVLQDGGSVILWHGAQDSYWFMIGGNPGPESWPRVVPSPTLASTDNLDDQVVNGDYVAIQGTGNLKCMHDATAGGTRKTLCNYNGTVTLMPNQTCAAPLQPFKTVSSANLSIPLWGCVNTFYDYTQPAWIVTGKNF